MSLRHLLGSVLLCVLAACGGGGGNPGDPGTGRLDQFGDLSLRATNISTFAYDPFTSVRLEATVTGLPAGTTPTFSVTALPAGLTLNTATGVISGLPAEIGFRQDLTLSMTAPGFAGDTSVGYQLAVNGLSHTRAATGGFALTSPSSASGLTGVAGTIEFRIGQDVFEANAVRLAQPLPAGATARSGFLSSNATGATIDPATGTVRWTPPGPGVFAFEVFTDVSLNGVTRRARSGPFAVNVR